MYRKEAFSLSQRDIMDFHTYMIYFTTHIAIFTHIILYITLFIDMYIIHTFDGNTGV